jgi:hypothetical protein
MVLHVPLVVDFALQSGGAQGTWLDRLLREPWLKIDGISGTSAGAITPPYSPTVMPKAVPRARAALETFYSRRLIEASVLDRDLWWHMVAEPCSGCSGGELAERRSVGAMSALGRFLPRSSGRRAPQGPAQSDSRRELAD